MLFLLLFLILFFNLLFNDMMITTAFPVVLVESFERNIKKRDIAYSLLTHTGLPEDALLWMYLAIFALVYLIITSVVYTVTYMFCRPKKEEYPILGKENEDKKSKGSISASTASHGGKTEDKSVDSSLTRSTIGRPPSSIMSISERENQELRQTRAKMKTAKGEFISARGGSLSELDLVKELNEALKSEEEHNNVSAKTAASSTKKMKKQEQQSGSGSTTQSKQTTSTTTSQETSASGSSSEKSDKVYNLPGRNSDSARYGSGSESDSNDLSKSKSE